MNIPRTLRKSGDRPHGRTVALVGTAGARRIVKRTIRMVSGA